MSRKIFIAGNWKMNKSAAETKELCEALGLTPPEGYAAIGE